MNPNSETIELRANKNRSIRGSKQVLANNNRDPTVNQRWKVACVASVSVWFRS